MVEPQCRSCKHLHDESMTCDAYPDDIPDEILLNKHWHTKPFPGDHGILYEPLDADDETASQHEPPVHPLLH